MTKLISVILLVGSVIGQGRFPITGVVTDTEGNPLPGAQITIEHRAAPAAVADARGAFEIPDLPAGAYTVRATLPGFRPRSLSVPLQGPLKAPIKLVLTVGILIEAIIPLPDPKEALQRADAIALVRLEGVAPPVSCEDLVVVSALHNATVLEVWKGKVPAKIQILEAGKGACVEGDREVRALGGISSLYQAGTEYVVLLSGKGPRFGSLGLGSYVFAVSGQTVSTDGFMGFENTMPLRAFQQRIRESSSPVALLAAQSADRLEGKNVSIAQIDFKGRSAIRVLAAADAPNAASYAVVKDTSFRDGTIEVDLAGQPAAGAGAGARGFIGIAFRLQGDGAYEYIYLRPTNGRADDQVRRNHSTQYSSHPDFDFARLRKEAPEKYESYVDLEPGVWTKYRIEVAGRTARLYVHGAEQPCLIVNDLKLEPRAGGVALWVGPGTEGYFANLKITPR